MSYVRNRHFRLSLNRSDAIFVNFFLLCIGLGRCSQEVQSWWAAAQGQLYA